MGVIRFLSWVSAFVLVTTISIADPSRIPVTVQPTPFMDFEPRLPEKRTFGPFAFKGGAYLQGDNKDFGGLSGLHVFEKGQRFLAVTDTGNWVSGEITRAPDGAISGFDNVHMKPLYSGEGPRNSRKKYHVDAEGLVISGEDVFVAFEAINIVSEYKLNLQSLDMEPTVHDLPVDGRAINFNKGVEALATPPTGHPLHGHLIAISEQGATPQGPTFGWILKTDGKSEHTGQFTVQQSDNFHVTEAGFLPNGDLIVLERRFTIATGVGMRLRHIAGDTIKTGANLTGKIVFEADVSFRIDNMEAMSVYENEKGETVLAFLSDDNHSLLQRTVYFEFILSDGR